MIVYDNGNYRNATATEIAAMEDAAAQADAAERTRPLTAEEVTTLLVKQQINSLDIDDATASRMVDYHPTLNGSGALIKAGTRINWGGVIQRAAVDLWDTAENTPDAAPDLWEGLPYKDGVRIIPEIITAGTAFAEGELGWWGETLMRSKLTANVWTPEQYPDGWEAAV